MDTTYGRAVALAIPVFITLVVLEIVVDRIRGTRYYHFADALNSLSCGILSTGMRVFFGFIGVFAYELLLVHAAPFRLPTNSWWTYVFAFVLYDLCYYWNHRLSHTVGIFWASHVVHHQSEEFNLTTALRQSGTGSFFGWIFFLPMALSGIPLGTMLIVGVIQLFYQFWPHTRLIGRLGALDRWIQTPSNHRVHHAQNDIYLDKNYVGVFLIWDRLFGTFQEELDCEPCIYGIRGQLRSWNPVWANLHYYWAMALDCWHARSWRDKLRVWFAHPGWRPPDVAALFPKAPYDPVRDFSRYDPPRNTAMSWYVLAQFSAVIVANSHFLALLPAATVPASIAYFGFLIVTLVTVGGLLENRREFVILEALRLAMTGVFVLATGLWFGGPVWIPAIASFAGMSVLWLWLAARARLRTSESSVAAAA